MAKIHEDIVVIKLSKLIKYDALTAPIATDALINALQQVAEELSDVGVIVEVDRA